MKVTSLDSFSLHFNQTAVFGLFVRGLVSADCEMCVFLPFYSPCSYDRIPEALEKPEGEMLFQQAKITEVLGGSGYNTEKLATPYIPQFTGINYKTASNS